MSTYTSSSGKGNKPLSRRTNIDERLELFIKRLEDIDQKYSPTPAIARRKLSKQKYSEFTAQYSEWKKHLNQLVRTEKKYLSPQKSEEDTKAKMRIGSYQTRISEYRKRIKSIEKVNPLFYVEIREIIKLADNPNLIKKIFEGYLKKSPVDIDNQAFIKTRELKGQLTDKDYESSLQLIKLIPHPIFSYLQLSKREKDILKAQKSKAFNESHTENVLTIPIHKYLQWMERVLNSFEKHDYLDLTLALCLATGRRPIEILKLGEFKHPQQNTVIFKGQAKQKQDQARHNTQGPLEFRIPLLYAPRKCILAMARIRELKKDDFHNATNIQIHSRTSSSLNNRIRFALDHDEIKVRSLRSAYARLCIIRFYQATTHGTEEAYLASILGHGENDKITVQHYKSVIFDKKDTHESATKYWAKIDAQNTKQEGANIDNCNKIIENLKEYDGKFRGAKLRIYKYCLDQLIQGNNKITLTYLRKKGGFSYPAIKQFMQEVGAIFEPSKKHIDP